MYNYISLIIKKYLIHLYLFYIIRDRYSDLGTLAFMILKSYNSEFFI